MNANGSLPAIVACSLIAAALAGCAASAMTYEANYAEQLAACTFEAGRGNDLWSLEPGWQAVYEGDEDGRQLHLEVRVLDETRVVDGVTTRVVVEEESVDGALVEHSRNFFALCRETGSVWYFGEEVDDYEDGRIVSHDGAWLAGQGGAEAGVMMPGAPTAGMKHYQEQAPGIAMDFAEVVSVDETVETPAGTFEHAIKIREGTPLEPDAVEYKWYAPGVGLVVDSHAKLVRHGSS